ncbi:MAG TPA: amidohydrolase family protein [Burkholderiales bacterium]|nr:amidohydrolase family protein [Burkholderiales bacterium]
MSEQKPEYREDDSWFSEAQLERLAPADHADRLHSPIPTQMVSNGEYMPIGQTDKQKEVEARLKVLSEQAARDLGMSRRKFLTTTGGFAASFLAMNEVFGRFFDVRPIDMLVPQAYAEGAPQGVFVFDDQTHIIRHSRVGPGNALRDIAEGNHNSFNPNDLPDELGRVNFPWNPALVGLPNLNENFHLAQYMKDVYLDSQVTVAIMTNNNSAAIPGAGGSRPPKNVAESEAFEILTAEQTMATRDWVNQLAGSKRMLGHGQLYTGVGNLWFIEEQIERLKPDSWKGYNIAAAAKVDTDPNSDMRRWTLDDPLVAYPTYAKIDEFARKNNGAILKQYPGFRNLSIHKGLSTNAGRDPRLGHPADIPRAAADWPQFNFIIYHSCIRPGFWVLNALNDIRSGVLREGVPDILWTTEMAVLAAPFSNVYAELGTTFASSVITFPTVCAHILGQLLKFMGEDRIVFGSDTVWYGAPQWQIEALWRFQIPEEMCRRYGYPRLTPLAKRKILGLNSARLYGLEPPHNTVSPAIYKPIPKDYQSRMTLELKQILEDPSVPPRAAAPGNQFAQYASDGLAKIKESYVEGGGMRSNTRYGWLRTKA